MAEIKVGVIGAGTMGKHHVRLLNGMKGVRLIGVADSNPAVLKQMARDFRVQGFSDFRKLLAQGPEAVTIAVPTSLHCKMGLAAIEAGCHVLLEKPIASTSAQARRLIHAAKHNRVNLMIGHTERFNPVVAAARETLKGERIISLDMTRVGPLPPRVKDIGIIIDLAIHDIDLIRYLTGAEIKTACSLHQHVDGPHEDTAMISLKLDTGAMAHITTNWLTPFKARAFQIATKKKFIKADLLTQTISIYSRVAKNEDGGLIREARLPYQEPLKLELGAFIAALNNHRPVPIPGQDGLKALLIAEHCLKTGIGGMRVRGL